MSWAGRSVLAVIPARGGSKGIPRKNLCVVGGSTLVGRALHFARELEWIDRVVLSTDSEEIAEEGRRHGVEVPTLRPVELATDTVRSVEVWRHAWLAAEEEAGHRFDVSLLLQPTSPLRTAEDAERTIASLIDGDHLAAATVSRTPGHFTPEKTLTVTRERVLASYLPAERTQSIRQLIPPYFHLNGHCYGAQRRTVVDAGTLLEDDCVAVEIERPVVNIDEPFDLELADWLLARESESIARSFPPR